MCNEDFKLFDTIRVWVFDNIFCLFIISFGSIYRERTFIPRKHYHSINMVLKMVLTQIITWACKDFSRLDIPTKCQSWNYDFDTHMHVPWYQYWWWLFVTYIQYQHWANVVLVYMRIHGHQNCTYKQCIKVRKEKEKEKEKRTPYIVQAWMWARYPNAKHDLVVLLHEEFLGGGLFQLPINLYYPDLGRCNGGLFVVKFPFVEYKVS